MKGKQAPTMAREDETMTHTTGQTPAYETELTPAKLAWLRDQSDLATACLIMCSVHVTMPHDHSFVVRAFPWECFDVAAHFHKLGADWISVYPGRGSDHWHWYREDHATTKRRARKSAR